MEKNKVYLLVLTLILTLIFTACNQQVGVPNDADNNELVKNEEIELERETNESEKSTEEVAVEEEPKEEPASEEPSETTEEIEKMEENKVFSIDDYLLEAKDFINKDYSQYLDGNHELFIEFPSYENLGRFIIKSKDSYDAIEELIFDNELNIYRKDSKISNLKWENYSITDADDVIDSILLHGDKQNYIVEMLNDRFDSVYGVIDYNGNWLVEPIYKEIRGLDTNHIGLGLKGKDRWYAISIDGGELEKIDANYNTISYSPFETFAYINGKFYFKNEETRDLVNEEAMDKMSTSNLWNIHKDGKFHKMQYYDNYPDIEVYILDEYLNIIDFKKIKPDNHAMISSDGKIDKVYSELEYNKLLKTEVEFEHNGSIYKQLEFDDTTMDNAIFYDKQFWEKTDSWYYYIMVTDLNNNVLFDETTKLLTIGYDLTLKDKRFVSATIYAEDYAPAKDYERVIFDLKELKTMSMKEFLSSIAEKINLNLDEFIMRNSEDGELNDILSFCKY